MESKKDEEITTIPELVGFIKNSFQAAQNHLDENFATKKYLDGRFLKAEEDISSIKSDVSTLKVDVALMKVDMSEVKKDVSELKENFNMVVNKEDKAVKKESTTAQEETMTTLKLKRHENWFMQIADKLGIKLEH